MLTALVALPTPADAQLLGNTGAAAIALSPEYPRPGQEVSAQLYAPLEDIAAASIVWFLDDTPAQAGEGDTLTFTAPALGESVRVTVIARTAQGAEVSDTVLVQPAEVVLAWEGATYAPPWYRGTTYYTAGADIRAEAFAFIPEPTGGVYDAAELIYTWSRNGVVLGELSGVGANTLNAPGPRFLGEDVVSVVVQSPDGLAVAEAAVQIATHEPHLALYSIDPLIGTQYHRAITQGALIDATARPSLVVIPYFFSANTENDPALQHTWSVNGTRVEPSRDVASVLNVQLGESDSLNARVSVEVEHTTKLLQSAVRTWDIVFGGAARGLFFGF